jgi:hypothetical protein
MASSFAQRVPKAEPLQQQKKKLPPPGPDFDPLEREAERFAQGIGYARGKSGTSAGGSSNLRQDAVLPARQIPLPSDYRSLFSTAGKPLDPVIRSEVEPHLGIDLGAVRVHTGGHAAEAARTFDAEAFTVGTQIAFDTGRYAPHAQSGKKLLAHELAHVRQQSMGRGTGSLQRQGKPGTTAQTKSPEKILDMPYDVYIDRPMNPEEVLDAFLRQYYQLSSDAQVAEKRKHWRVEPSATATAQDAARGFVVVLLKGNAETYLSHMSKEEKEATNKETDRRFWDKTGYKPGQKLGNSAKDREMAKEWMKTREGVLLEDSQRRQIEALPPDVRALLFAGGTEAAPIQPADYPKVLALAQKLAALSPEQRADYMGRVNADTTSFEEMARSIDAYVERQQLREAQDKSTDKAARPLLGLDDLYREWKWWKNLDMQSVIGVGGGAVNTSLIESRNKRTAAFFAELDRQGFKTIASFEAAIEKYRVAFRDQTVRVARDAMDRYEHLLFLEKKKFEKQDSGVPIAKAIGETKAAEHFKTANSKSTEAMFSRMGSARQQDSPQFQKRLENASRLSGEANALRSKGESEVNDAAADPLVKERDIDREALSGMDGAAVRAYMLKEIATRYDQLKEARAQFTDDPDRVFSPKLAPLREASREQQEIGTDTVYWSIVQDYVEGEGAKKLLSTIAITIIAIALAALVPGGGLVAAGALVASAGISTFQAYEAWDEYKKDSNDYTLGFLDDKPSFGWVVVAIAAAALDTGLAVSEIVTISAKGLRQLEGPLRLFAEEKDAAKLAERMEKIEGLHPKLQKAMQEKALAIEEESKAWKAALGGGPAMAVPSLSVLLAVTISRYGKALYKSIRAGIKTFTALRKDAAFIQAMGDITKMSGTEREMIKTAFEELKDVVAAGKKMDEATLEVFVDRWVAGRAKGGDFQEKLLDEMKVWKPLSKEQQAVKTRLLGKQSDLKGLYRDKAEAMQRRAELLAQPSRTPEEVKEIHELVEELDKLDPLWNKSSMGEAELAQLRRQRLASGKGLGKIHADEVALEAFEKEAQSAELSLYDRLRAAAPSEKAKEQALRGVSEDQVGKLIKSSGELHVDHIVSVDEIAEMDGFKELTWANQKRIVDMKENLIAMDSAANLSKSNRTWRSWPQASNYYDEATRLKMIGKEDAARAAIQHEIASLRSVSATP